MIDLLSVRWAGYALCALMMASSVSAELLPPPSVSVSLPGPAPPNAFGVSVAFGPNDGLMYVWDGANVLKQNGFNSDNFVSIGTVGSGSADAGPIAFSRDAARLLVGNGGGGILGGAHAGLVFGIPASGGDSSSEIAKIDFHHSFLAAPLGASNDKFFVDSGNASFTGSSVSVFDQVTGSNATVIDAIPGASASMAVGGGRLYVGVGFGPSRGELRSFALSDLDTAYDNATQLDWGDGALLNDLDNNSGAGMFIDARGFLFTGGPDGVTMFDTQGNNRLYENQGYSSVEYDRANDRFLVTGFGNEQGIYPASAFFFLVPEPSAAVLALLLAISCTGLARRMRRRGAPALQTPTG
jgi:hypothetical protein